MSRAARWLTLCFMSTEQDTDVQMAAPPPGPETLQEARTTLTREGALRRRVTVDDMPGDAPLPEAAQHVHQEPGAINPSLSHDASEFEPPQDLDFLVVDLYALFAKIGMDVTVRERMEDWLPKKDDDDYLTNHKGLGIFWGPS